MGCHRIQGGGIASTKGVTQKMKTTGQQGGGQFEGPAQDGELEQRKG